MSDNSNTANQIVSVQNGMNHIDNLISLRIFKTIEKLTQNLNLKSICFLIFLLGIDSVKRLAKKSIDDFLEKIQKINFKYLLSKMLYKNEKKEEIKTTAKNVLKFSYHPKNVFWEALGKLLKEGNVIYEIKSHEIIQESKTEYALIQQVENFTINCGNFTCYIGSLELVFQCTENEKKFKTANGYVPHFDKSKTLLENLPFPDFVKAIENSNIIVDVRRGFYRLAFSEPRNNIRKTWDYYQHGLDPIIDLIPILFANKNDSCVHILKGTKLFGIEFDEFKITLESCYSWGNVPDAEKVQAWVDNQIQGYNQPKGQKKNLNLVLESKDLSLDLLTEWTRFVDVLQKDCSFKENISKIKIYDLKMDIKIDVLNLEKDVKIEQGKDNVKDEDKDKEPRKFTVKTKTVKETMVNEIWKDFDTLYLKEKDMFFLNNTLCRFKNKKETYTHLGLPYKFGALLYGEPGTGKSSCINAIASYLRKDIYYLDLTTIETNDDLKALFSHINKEKKDNGIIVIEDIDAMTDVVKKRTPGQVQKELTLECLLNLLQGTLTHDGTTFIVTTNHIEVLDPAFYRDGRFDIKIELTACDHYQMNSIYKKFFERNIPGEILKKLPEYKITPATFIQNLLPFIIGDSCDDEILKCMQITA